MADTNFSRSSGTGATGWLVGGAIAVFLVLDVALAFSGPSGAPPAPSDGATSMPGAIEPAPVQTDETQTAPAQPAVPSQ